MFSGNEHLGSTSIRGASNIQQKPLYSGFSYLQFADYCHEATKLSTDLITAYHTKISH